MPDGTQFPTFPTQFGEEDVERLRQLEEQRRALEKAYKVKFSEQAWARTPSIEKAVRRITPPWLVGTARALTPGIEPTTEFGFTPEQYQEQATEIEEEFKELSRKQKVTSLLPDIQSDIMIAALSGEPIRDISELLSAFPELRSDFTEEEINYLSRMSQVLLRATPEQIMSGEVFAYEPSQLPITEEDIDALFREGIQDPRQIFATVEFAKNLEDVTQALKEAYPSETTDEEAQEALRSKLRDYFKQRSEELGITVEGEQPTKAVIEEIHKRVAEEAGTVITLTNDRGELFSARRKSDNTVWIGEELIGYWEDGRFLPFSIQGQPLTTVEEQESAAKDLWDAFYLGMVEAGHGFKEASSTTIPMALVNVSNKIHDFISPYKLEGERKIEWMESVQRDLAQSYSSHYEEHQAWLADHPELTPRQEYLVNPFDNPDVLRDPYYWGYTILSNAPILAAAVGTGIVTSVATGNPLVGAVAGAAIITPVEIQNVQDDLVANGADPASASLLATSVGTAIGAVEIVPGMIAMKAIAPAFSRVFRKGLSSELTKNVVRNLGVKGILKTATRIEVAETIEEVIQESMQNAAVKTINENRSLVENLDKVAIDTAISVLPLAAFGGGAEYVGMKSNLPPEVKQEIDTTSKELQTAGLSEEHAEAVAVSQVLETETGQAQVQEAVDKAVEQAPSDERITKLEARLSTYDEEIGVTKSSIEAHKGRLAKMKAGGELPSEQLAQLGKIQDLEARLTDLERDQKAVQKKIQRAKKKLTEATEKVVPITPEVIETPQEEAVTTETAPRQVIAPYLITDPLIHQRRPRTIEWELEQENVNKTLGNPSISKNVKIPKDIIFIRERAAGILNRLQEDYKKAKKAKDKEAIKEVESKLKGIARDAGLSRKALLGKGWDDLPPDDRIALAISLIPDKSLKFHAIKEGFDMEYFMEFLEEMTGAPFYSMLRRIEAANAATETEKERILQRITTDPHFKDIRTDEEALARVAQEINARNEIQGVEHPENLTENEMLLADAITDVYNAYKPIVRYLRVMRTDSDIEAFKKEFPDAVEAGKELELEMTLKLKEEGNLDDLWAYLFTLDWGVIEHGFDPRLIASPGLKVRRRGGLKATRGKGRLMRRESIEYPAGKMSMNVLVRLASYIEQMEIQWRIEPEIDSLAGYWGMVGDKFEDWGQIERGLETWLERVQSISLGYNFFDRQVRKLWRQAMASVFLEPFMPTRNSFQSLFFHPARIELFRLLLQHLPTDLSEKGKLYFDTFVSQLGGLRRDWLHVGEKGFLVPDWWNRLADSLNVYGWSDYFPRLWSFKASLNKAQRATKAYQKHGDVDKWVKDSGAIHLRRTERNYAISHYLGQPDAVFNLDVPGLHEVSGTDMANFYVAQRIADGTHFKYRRSSRGLIEMGKTGSTLWNLVVFPRGYAQRLYFQAEKIRNAFRGEATWEEARSGFNDIVKLAVSALLMGQLFFILTGRRRNPYDPLNILFGWQFGGLFVGIAQDVSVFMGDMAAVINPFSSDEDKDFALNRIPLNVSRIPETLVPFFRRAIDIAEMALERKNIVAFGVRKLRGELDKDYTPEELDKIDRNLWEKIRKSVLGGEVQDPTKLQVAMESIDASSTQLGTMDVTGRYYTVGNFGTDIAAATRAIPDILITEQEGFTPLVLFYKDCEAQWRDLYKLPSKDREDWRKSHILEEAMLLFWEKYQGSVFIKDSPEAEQVKSLLQMWFDQYDIDRTMHRQWTGWNLPVEIPLPEEE